MTTVSRPKELTGQAYVKSLSEKALHTVELNYRGGTDYVDVDLKNQANAEESASHNYRGRFLFELLQNASDAIVATQDYPEWAKQDSRPCAGCTTVSENERHGRRPARAIFKSATACGWS